MSRTALIWTIIGVLALTAFGCLFIVAPALAQREWEVARAALEAKGENLLLEDFPQPGKIPDEKNFFADPIWWELSDRELIKTDVGFRHSPRLPESKRQLSIFRRSFVASEIESLKARFPEFARSLSAGPQSSVMQRLWKNASKDPAQARRAAELVLELQSPLEPMISRLRELSKRADAFFPLEYSDGILTDVQHAMTLMDIVKWLDLRAKAMIELKDYRAAFQETLLIFRLRDALQQDSLQRPWLVEMSITGTFTDLVDLGISAHAWTADELRTFDRMLGAVDAPKRLAAALRKERALFISITWPSLTNGEILLLTQNAGSLGPTPVLWIYRAVWMPGDKTLYCDLVQQEVESLDAVPEKGMNAKLFPDRWQDYVTKHPGVLTAMSKLLTRLAAPMQASAVKAARVQTSVLLTRIAIALELHRMEYGQYPDSLDAVKSAFPYGIPLDIITLQPFLYQRNEKGDFTLWSVGWNGIDEKGLIERHPTSGDWVWGD